MGVTTRRRREEEGEEGTGTSEGRSGTRPAHGSLSFFRLRNKLLRLHWAWYLAALVLAVGVGWWLLVLKWEWYCFAWHAWFDPSHVKFDERVCRAVQAPYIERTRLITAAYGFRSVWEGQLDVKRVMGELIGTGVALPDELRRWQEMEDERQASGGKEEKRRVVVKELKDPKSCGDVKAHFREVSIERRLNHPSIVPFIAACNIAPHYILVSDFLAGGTLSAGITPSMKPRTYLSIMLDLAKGLEYLHYGVEKGWTLIHDDLNTEQILLNANRTKAYITDFNLGSWIRTGDRWCVRRYWWPKGGSWKWFAPEKLRLHYYWETADVWSFAVLFYQTLARANNQPDEWMAKVNREFYETRILTSESDGWRPAKLKFKEEKEVLNEAWSLVEECWQYNPYARPNATQIVASLENLLKRTKP